ncbi:MAG TPA: NapC/NirT family cytochrome c [Bryobacteraceae bacterium]|jgi:nitrate/TMAO reductase-like tetraheme cytochrome c subunit
MPAWLIPLTLGASALLAVVLGVRAQLTRSREGKILAFLALLILPIAAAGLGFSEHLERAQSRAFCLSCHVMEGYGKSLLIDDPSYIPARHYQNNLVPRDRACYTCHTTYTLFGGMHAKIRGLRHLYVQYLGTVPKPEEIKLYEPYNNRECLSCHLGARKFEEASGHHKSADLLGRIKSNRLSCISSGCHEFIHDVGSLGQANLWKESK